MQFGNNIKFFPVSISDIYATITHDPIYYMKGFEKEDRLTEQAASEALNGDISHYFITGNKIISYLTKYRVPCSDTITFVIPNLRNLYYVNQVLFPIDEIPYITQAITEPLATFHDIYTYKNINSTNLSDDIIKYQLFGIITPYDVIHLPLNSLISHFNQKAPLDIQLGNTNLILRLNYEDYELWDKSINSVITHIPEQCRL